MDKTLRYAGCGRTPKPDQRHIAGLGTGDRPWSRRIDARPAAGKGEKGLEGTIPKNVKGGWSEEGIVPPGSLSGEPLTAIHSQSNRHAKGRERVISPAKGRGEEKKEKKL